MIAFAKALPRIRARTNRDVKRRGLPREKVLATVIQLMETTLVRVGNDEYARQNNSYGLTTLRDKHVRTTPHQVRFRFNGKHGVAHEIELDDPRLARIVRDCQELPGYELFQYVDDDGVVRDVGSSMPTSARSPARNSRPRIFGRGRGPCWRRKPLEN